MDSRPNSLWLAFVLPALLLTLIFRLIPAWGIVAKDNDFRLFGVDSYYHLRHVERTVETFPHMDRTESVSAYPAIERSDAIGLFQWTMAGISKALGASGDPIIVQWVCAWSGPVAAMLIVLMGAIMALRVWGWQVSVIVTWLLTFLPGRSFDRTVLGFCDHHGMEVVFNLSVCLALVIAAQSGASRFKRPLTSLVLGLPSALFLFTWIGAPLFVGLACAGFGVAMLWCIAAGKPVDSSLKGFAGLMAGAFILSAIISRVAPFLVIDVGVYQQMEMLMAAAAIGAWLAGCGIRVLQNRFPPRVVTFQVLVAAVISGFTLTQFVPSAIWYLHMAFDSKSGAIQEHQPFVWPVIWSNFGPTVFLALLGSVWALIRSQSLSKAEHIVLPILWSYLIIWRFSGDYDYNVTPAMVLLTGSFWGPLLMASKRIGEGTSASSPGRLGASLRVAPAAIVFAAVVATIYPLGSVAGAFRPAQFFRTFTFQSDAWRQAMGWLRMQGKPNGGVWCHWPYGNLVSAIGRWPAIQSRYPRGHLLEPMFTPGEDRALQKPVNGMPFAEAARFVIADASLASKDLIAEVGHLGLEPSQIFEGVPVPNANGKTELLPRFNTFYTQTLLGRLYTLNGSDLKHFRAVFESEDHSYLRYFKHPDGRMGVLSSPAPGGGPELEAIQERIRIAAPPWNEGEARAYGALLMPSVKIFELVAGARVEFVDPSVLTAHVELVLEAFPSGRRFVYRQEGERSVKDALTFHLPYSHDPGQTVMVWPTGPYRLTATLIGGRTVRTEFTLPEEAVVKGRQIRMEGQLQNP